MPDTLSLSASVSFGLLAGIVSGVCYLVANGLTWPKNEEQRSKRCITKSADDEVCRRCGGDVRGGFVPCICHPNNSKPVKFESGAWFLRQAQRAVSLMPWSISTDKLEQIDEECEGQESGSPGDRGELRNVREFLETLSAKLAGGTLEGTRVAPLYDHPAYLPAVRNAQSSASSSQPSSGASGAHAQLKRLVARVVEEAAALPALARYAAEPSHTPTIESSTYEDLLATAILNKVIERYQTENGSGGRSSGIHSASASPTPSERSSPRSLNSRHTRDITPPLREEDDVSDWEEGEATDDALEVPRRVPFPEFGGDIVHHTDNEDRDFDEVSSSDIQAVDGTWEENWLFQKKKIKTIQSVPVPMLVPNSNTEYRALIGDRDADDTTDLSDNASDAEEEAEYKSDIQRVLDSKHVIGGKPKIDEVLDYEPDSLNFIGDDEFEKIDDGNNQPQGKDVVDAINNEIKENNNDNVENSKETTDEIINNGNDSILVLSIDSGPVAKTEFSLKEEIHRTLLNGNLEEYAEDLNTKSNGEMSNDSLENFVNTKGSTNTLSRHEREGEYEETFTVPVQRYADSLRRKHFDDETQQIPTRDTDKEEDLIPGTIAYRERKKWLNYVEMPNNPYSPEAIQKRLSTKSTSSLFDMLTKSKDIDEDVNITEFSKNERKELENERKDVNIDIMREFGEEKDVFEKKYVDKIEEIPVKDINHKIPALTISTENLSNGTRTTSPSPKILKDVLAEEVPQYKRYGRDYYIKEAKASSGGRKKNSFSDTSSVSSMNKSTSLDNFDTEFPSPGLLIKQFNVIATNQQYTKFAVDPPKESITTTAGNNKTDILIEYEDVNEQTLFAAKLAYTDEDTDRKFDEILQTAYKTDVSDIKPDIHEPVKSPTSLENSYVSSSSMEDSIKIYNVQTGEIVKCKPEDNLSDRYEPPADSNNIDTPDKTYVEETVDNFSENSDVVDEAVIDFRDHKLEKISELDEILPQLPKVKELAKIFVSMENINEPIKPPQPHTRRRKSRENILNPDLKVDKNNKQMYMHSLTARSISKEFRDELKLSLATPLKVPGGSKEIPEGIEEVTKESSRPGSPLPEPGTIKTKLAFFESLKSKFSNNK